VRIAECDIDIVAAVTMHERRSMRSNLDFENANVFVLQGKVVRGFRCDLDFGRGLRSQEWNQQEEEQYALHGGEIVAPPELPIPQTRGDLV
jgi:hypothetical protein